MYPQKIVKIKRIGIKPTVDIEVGSAEHLFYGNGIATSNSHAVSYAVNAYLSAFAKAHFPRIFFASYLRFAKDKIDPKAEIKELIQNANAMDIEVRVPDIRYLNKLFILKDKKIYFGLTDIKGFGESVYQKLYTLIKQLNIDFETVEWLSFAGNILCNISSISARALIKSGALSLFHKTRSAMLFEYELLNELTKKELAFLLSKADSYKTLYDALLDLFHNHKLTSKRKQTIQALINTANIS